MPGVDVAMMGPNDLSQSFGCPGETKDARVVEATEEVIAACGRHGVVPGTHVRGIDNARTWLEAGMRLVTFWNDIGMIVDSGRHATRELRDIVEELDEAKGEDSDGEREA